MGDLVVLLVLVVLAVALVEVAGALEVVLGAVMETF